MKVLVVGSGAREHALALKIAQSPLVKSVVVAPGNDGMSSSFERWEAASYEQWVQRAKQEGVGLAVIGPDNALAEGIVDLFTAHGILCFGPTARASKIESSKSYAKSLMHKAGIPTARAFVVQSSGEADRAVTELCAAGAGCVVKADGLAFGKGVEVCDGVAAAQRAIQRLFTLSRTLVIEERLSGQELSWFAFCDGERCVLWEPARDAKRLLDHDLGPNTGGMGAFSPVHPFVSNSAWMEKVRQKVFEPILKALKEEGAPFRGLLFAGLMAKAEGEGFSFQVLEYNARFGDPETQALLARFEGDLVPWLMATARGELNKMPAQITFSDLKSVYVVAASRGYPEAAELGMRLGGPGLNDAGAHTYFGAVKRTARGLECSGGRVFGSLGLEKDWDDARMMAYSRLGRIQFEGMQFRGDIAAGVKQ